MKALKIIGISVLTIIAILGIVVAFQPSQGHIEKSIVINAPASSIFPEVSNLEISQRGLPGTKWIPK